MQFHPLGKVNTLGELSQTVVPPNPQSIHNRLALKSPENGCSERNSWQSAQNVVSEENLSTALWLRSVL